MKYTSKKINEQNEEFLSNCPPNAEYTLQCVESGLAKIDLHALETWLRRTGNSFLLCISTTSTRTYNRKIVHRTGKPGRPKEEHIGKKVDTHFHLIIPCATMQQANTAKTDLLKYLKKRRAKHSNMRRPQSSIITSSTDLSRYIGYSVGQADNVFTGGDYDFDYFKEQPPFL